MSDIDFEKLGLEAWLYITCSGTSGIFHSSEFGKSSDGTWYWANPSRQEESISPQITLWSKNYLESRDEWVLRGAFQSTIRSEIYSEENLISFIKDFLFKSLPDSWNLGLHTRLDEERLKFEDHAFEGFGSDLNWRITWASLEKRDFICEADELHQSQLRNKNDFNLEEEWL